MKFNVKMYFVSISKYDKKKMVSDGKSAIKAKTGEEGYILNMIDKTVGEDGVERAKVMTYFPNEEQVLQMPKCVFMDYIDVELSMEDVSTSPRFSRVLKVVEPSLFVKASK